MASPSVLLALHRPDASPRLAGALAAGGVPVEATRNMAETWAAAHERRPDAVVVDPRSPDPAATEMRSLLALAAADDGPVLVVLSDDPLPPGADGVDDVLPTDVPADRLARRIERLAARRAELRQLHRERDDLLQKTITDFKTGLFNMHHFDERSVAECSRARRQGHPLGVLMLDLDNFKEINDAHDHVFGDHALLEFAKTLKGNLRPFDIAARYGGDEFVVLMPGAHLDDAGSIAERVRAAINRMELRQGKRKAKLTVSIGVATWDPADEDSFEARLRGADQALLAAKRAGRNRICVFQQDGQVEEVEREPA